MQSAAIYYGSPVSISSNCLELRSFCFSCIASSAPKNCLSTRAEEASIKKMK